MYKLLAVDMDGTLLSEDKTISKRNYEAIQKAKSRGVKVVLASGRPLKGIERYLKELDLMNIDDYAVAFNGAVIQNTKTGHVLSETPMRLEDLQLIYNLSTKLNVNIHVLTRDTCISPKISRYTRLEVDINEIPLQLNDFSNIKEIDNLLKVMLVDEPEKLSEAVNKIPDEFYKKYSILRSAPYFLEFLDKSVNKGAGVAAVAKKFGIKPEEIICIGDAGNDIHMIKFAGLGVAMGNAFENIKAAADYITLSNEENGVAHVIDKFILAS